MRYIRNLAFALALACCSASAALASERIPLTVDFGTARVKGHYPVTSGFPFARRALKSPRNISILEGGKAVATQARTIATWPDGSVKWALVDFLARPGSRYQLEYGAGVSPGSAAPGRMSASTGSVSTGEVSFKPSQATGFFGGATGHGLTLTGLRNFMDMVHVDSPADVPPVGAFAGGALDASQVSVERFAVEESGPVKAVVLISGKYKYRSTGNGAYNPFTVRLTAYRGFGGIMVQHTFIYNGVGDNDFCSGLGFDCRLSMDRSRATVTVGTLGGKDVTWRAGDAAAGSLSQLSPDHFRAERGFSDRHASGVCAEGSRSAGWVDISDGAKGLAVIHRNAFRRYPKSTSWDLTTGRLTVSLWPREAGLLDFRRYAREWGVGETGASENHGRVAAWAPRASLGVASTHTVMFYFHEGSASAGGVADAARALDQRPLAKAAPKYYASTKALGPYEPKGSYASIEQNMAAAVDHYLENMERFRWYGVWDYGAFQQRYNTHKHGRWENDWGRWGWAQNDGAGRISHHLMMRYLCTGDRKFFDVGEAACRNNYDGDTIHLGKNKGLAHRHGVQHWSGPYTGLRGSCPTGPKVLYYLTGDGRTRDAIETIAERAMRGFWEASGYIRRGGTPELHGVDGGGAAVQACYAMWEMTRDEKYHGMIRDIIRGTPAPKNSWEAVCTTSFGLSQMITDYYDLTGDPGSKAKTKAIADACYNNRELKKSYTYPGGYFRVFGDAYRLTGDAKYKTYLEEMFGALGRKMDGKRLMPNTGRDLPYAYYSLMHPPEPEGSCK